MKPMNGCIFPQSRKSANPPSLSIEKLTAQDANLFPFVSSVISRQPVGAQFHSQNLQINKNRSKQENHQKRNAAM